MIVLTFALIPFSYEAQWIWSDIPSKYCAAGELSKITDTMVGDYS